MLHLILEDGNSQLKNRKFSLGKGIKKHLQKTLQNYTGDKTIDGYKRLNNLLNMDGIEYNEMKRLKNFFDNYQGTVDNPTYILNGGDAMKNWVNNTLNSATTAIRDIKRDKKDMGIENAFIKKHTKNREIKPNKPSQTIFQTKNSGQKLDNNNNIKYESKERTVYITEKQLHLLKEAASESFSLNELSNIKSFKDRYKYCIQQLGPTQGRGSSRVVFQIDDNKVLKLALNEKGIAQNQAEDDRYLQSIGVSPKIFDNDSNYKWLVSEYVLPAKKQDFKECVGISFEDFCGFIQASFRNRWGKKTYGYVLDEYDYISLCEYNETCNVFDDYIGNYDPPMGDLLRIVNYGMVKRGSSTDIVLLDSGLTHEIWNNYYRR